MNEKVLEFKDKFITCVDCGDEFVFEAGEQAYFASVHLAEPKRCPACRAERKRALELSRQSNRGRWL